MSSQCNFLFLILSLLLKVQKFMHCYSDSYLSISGDVLEVGKDKLGKGSLIPE